MNTPRSGRIAATILAGLLLAVLTRTTTTAQTWAPADSCHDCYGQYRYDTNFTVGCYDNSPFISFLKNYLSVDWVRTYGGPADLTRFLADSTDAWPRSDWWKKFQIQRMRNLIRENVRVIYSIDSIRLIISATETTETFPFRTYPDNGVLDSARSFYYKVIDTVGAEPWDSLMGGYIRTQRIHHRGDGFPRLVAGRPTFTDRGFYTIRPVDYPPLPTGYQDSLKYYDVVVTMRPDTTTSLLKQFWDSLPADLPFAYVKLFRRTMAGQDSCDCLFFAPLDSIPLTRRMYEDVPDWAKENPNQTHGYRDLILTFQVLDTGSVFQPDSGRAMGERTCDTATCSATLASLKSLGTVPQGTVSFDASIEGSHRFYYDIHTSDTVSWILRGSRLHNHAATQLAHGAFDVHLDSIMTLLHDNDTLNALMLKYEICDEVYQPRYRTERMVHSILDRTLRQRYSDDDRGFFANPQGSIGNFRILAGDLDSTTFKVAQVTAIQNYNVDKDFPISVRYANPDSMHVRSLYQFYRPRTTLPDSMYLDTTTRATPDTIMNVTPVSLAGGTGIKRICFNNGDDYAVLTARSQEYTREKLRQYEQAIWETRRRFRHKRLEANPAWSVIQTMGFLNGEWTGFYAFSVPAPEYVSQQLWLSLSFGFDGLALADIMFDDPGNVGIHHWVSGDHTSEYPDTISAHDPHRPPLVIASIDTLTNDTTYRTPDWVLRKMWIGFNSRTEIIHDFMEIMGRTILSDTTTNPHNDTAIIPHVGRQAYLMYDRNPVHHYLADTGYHSGALGIIDDIELEHSIYWPADSVFTSQPTPKFDSADQRFMVASVHTPNLQHPTGDDYLVILTNTRTWPIDWQTYGAATQYWQPAGSSDSGFGAIDVRRPWVRFNRFFASRDGRTLMFDSVTIWKVMDTTWKVTVACDSLIALDWIKPGWGEMYRVKPISIGVSQHGVAYNNSVHAENLAGIAPDAPTFVVYERDSSVFIRCRRDGKWLREYMLSDSADTISDGVQRAALNFNPAIATVRTPIFGYSPYQSQTALVVWERRDINNLRSVEALWLDSLHGDWSNALIDSQRYHLSRPRLLPDNVNMAPAVVGVPGGYVVAFARPDSGISLIAVRDSFFVIGDEIVGLGVDTMEVNNIYSPFARDSIVAGAVARWPTLASVPLWAPLPTDSAQWDFRRGPWYTWFSTPSEGDIWSVPNTPEHYAPFWVVHLAYQQGEEDEGIGQQIIHHVIGIQFQPNDELQIRMIGSRPEHVSRNLRQCTFLHPSIAADSIRVGVAFEARSEDKAIALRFRNSYDSLGIWVPIPNAWAWSRAPYYWGDYRILNGGENSVFAGQEPNVYVRPSVTEFPAQNGTLLTTAARGMLTWQWKNPPDSAANATMLYRYGARRMIRGNDGQDVTMMFAPYVVGGFDTTYGATEIVRRGPDAEKFVRINPLGDSAGYYPIVLDSLFGQQGLLSGGESASIYPHFQAVPVLTSAWDPQPDTCSPIRKGFRWGYRIQGEGGGDKKPDLSPWFFSNPQPDESFVDSITAVQRVVRTSVFHPDTTIVTLEIRRLGNDSLKTWLNTQPYDSILGRSADVGGYLELVRVSDSSVIWSGDTLWGREVADSMLMDVVTIPIDTASIDTAGVFIRAVPVWTSSLDLELEVAYLITGDPNQIPPLPKRIVPGESNSAFSDTSLQVRVIPNPIRDGKGIVVVRSHRMERIVVRLYDGRGRQLAVIGEFTPDGPGEYAAPIDASRLNVGMYTVVAEQAKEQATVSVPVVR